MAGWQLKGTRPRRALEVKEEGWRRRVEQAERSSTDVRQQHQSNEWEGDEMGKRSGNWYEYV